MGQIATSLERGAHLIGRYLDSAAGQLGLTQGEQHVLAQLDRHGPMAIAALHAQFGHKRSTLTNILDRLENRKLVRRELNRNDRRSFIVSLTPQGRRIARQVTEVLDGLERQLDALVGKGDGESLDRILAALETIIARRRRT
jgi:DNA-binding MarR family transcriptional regulator